MLVAIKQRKQYFRPTNIHITCIDAVILIIMPTIFAQDYWLDELCMGLSTPWLCL